MNIADFGNTWFWYGTGKTEPLTIAQLEKGFEAMRERETEHLRWQVEKATEYREAMKDPAFAARVDALTQACIDVGCPFPDPLNPPIIGKAMYDAVNRRADEILAEKTS